MKYRKFIVVILMLSLLSSLFAGCGSQEPDQAVKTVQKEKTAIKENDGIYDVTYILCYRDVFLSVLLNAAVDNCPEDVKLKVLDAQNDSAKQIQMVEEAARSGCEAIIVILVDPNSAEQILEAAGNSKVVFMNKMPADLSILEEGRCVYVGVDENSLGRLQGEFLVDYFRKKGQTDVRCVLIQGMIGQTATKIRTESVLETMEQGGLNVTLKEPILFGAYDRYTASEVFSQMLDENEADFDCLISHNDEMAIGAIQVMKSRNMDPAQIPIVGIDATADGLQAIKDGEMAMSVFQDSDAEGRIALQAARNLVKGLPIDEGTGFSTVEGNPALLWISGEAVTSDNAFSYEEKNTLP